MNVDDDAILDATLRDFLRDRASDTAGIRDASTMASAISTHLDRVRSHQPTLRTRFQTMSTSLKIAAVAVLALAIGIGVVQLRPATDKVGSVRSPSPSPSRLVWSPASIEQDWPAPVREEPVGDPVVIPIADGYLDPSGDIESPDMPWIDILHVTQGQSFGTAQKLGVDVGAVVPPGLVVPSDPWIAYGLVFDTDLDGVADVRLGLDRVPAELRGGAPGDIETRVWRTDLHTGTTEGLGQTGVEVCDCLYPHGPEDMTDVFVQVFGAAGSPPPGTEEYRPAARFIFYEFPPRFYAWASVIQDGRVVATDYAPDTGWLEPTVWPEPTDQPGGSPAP